MDCQQTPTNVGESQKFTSWKADLFQAMKFWIHFIHELNVYNALLGAPPSDVNNPLNEEDVACFSALTREENSLKLSELASPIYQ